MITNEPKIAIEAICKTIIGDKNVEAIFVQGELAEEYFDEHSIIDLYLVVERSKMDYVLDKRYEYLESYKQIIHHFLSFSLARKSLLFMKMDLE